MALITTVSPTVTERGNVPGIPDDGDGNLAGEIDRNDVDEWGFDSTFAPPSGLPFENPDWSAPEIDIGQGHVYRHEPDGQKLYTVSPISNVSLQQDADNYVFFTSEAEYEIHDADEPPSDEAVLIGIIDTLNNRIDDDVRGRSPIPPEFVQVFTGTGAASAPLEVTTLNVDAIASTEARLIGNLNGLGGANQATVYFQYREGTASTWQQTNEQTRATAGEFDADIDSLTAGTTHIFRAIAYNPAGQVVLGNEEKFTTLAAGTTNPTIVTDPVGTVTADSADLNGELTSLGSYSDVFCFFQREKVDDGTTLLVPGGPTLSSTGTYQITANALVAGTKYRYRAVGDYGTNDDKRITGDWVTFTTSGGSGLGVTTDAETGLGDHTATLNGTLDNMGPNTSVDVGFEFRETGDSVWRRRNAGFVTTTGPFSYDLDTLLSGTQYEFRATAEGGGVTVTGTTVNFTTEIPETMIEDFESGDLSAWNNTPSVQITTNSIAGDFSGEGDGSGGTNNISFDGATPSAVSFLYHYANGGPVDGVLWNGDGGFETGIRLSLGDIGDEIAYNGNSTGITIPTGQAVEIRCTNIDFSGSYDIEMYDLSGTLLDSYTGASFDENPSEFDILQHTSVGAGGRIDNIRLLHI